MEQVVCYPDCDGLAVKNNNVTVCSFLKLTTALNNLYFDEWLELKQLATCLKLCTYLVHCMQGLNRKLNRAHGVQEALQ